MSTKVIQKANQSSVYRANNGWYPVGPFNKPANGGNYAMSRANCICFNPINEKSYFLGMAQGGIWKTTDDGATWTDNVDVSGIITVATSGTVNTGGGGGGSGPGPNNSGAGGSGIVIIKYTV